MTTLNIEPTTAINVFVLISQIVIFVFIYQKKIKSTVNTEDLKDLRSYVDQQDRALHHRINGVEDKIKEDISNIRIMTQSIYDHLLNTKK